MAVNLHDIKEVRRPSFQLEIGKTHRHVFLPDILGRHVSAVTLYRGKLIVLPVVAVPGFQRDLPVGSACAVFEHDALVLRLVLVVPAPPWTVRLTHRIHKDLASPFVLDPFQLVKAVVEIVIQHHEMVIFFQFLIHLVDIADLLAGRAVDLEARIVPAHIFLQER